MTMLLDDLMARDAIADPHAACHRLRETEAFSAGRMAFLEREISAEDRRSYRPIFDVLSHWMVFIDPPDHTRLRRLLSTRFTPRAVEQYRPRVRSIVNALLRGLVPRRGFEVVHDFAYMVPLTVILELLGAPAGDRLRGRRVPGGVSAAAHRGASREPDARPHQRAGCL